MAFIKLNNFTVPLMANSVTYNFVETSSRATAFDGTPLTFRLNNKREISMTTAPLSETDAKIVENIILGEGQYWSFDEDSTISAGTAYHHKAFLYSSKGYGATSANSAILQDTTNTSPGSSGALNASTTLTYPSTAFLGANDLTVNLWASKADGNVTTAEYLFALEDSGANNLYTIFVRGSSENIDFVTKGGGYTSTLGPSAHDFTGIDNFNMITCVLRKNPAAGEYNKEVWIDGVRISYASISAASILLGRYVPDFSLITEMSIGTNAATKNFSGRIDDVLVVPYAASSDLISAWYGLGDTHSKDMCPLPKFYVDGDIIPDDIVSSEFEGSIEDITFVKSGDGPLRQISFTIYE